MQNILFKNNVIDPSWELVPTIRISPFSNAYLIPDHTTEVKKKEWELYLKERFGTYFILPKGRTAIGIALSQYNLRPDDVVTILTTSGNFYISSCVTKEIEKVCQWNRELTEKTKLIFVNHEFGYPYQGLSDLKKYGLPIIEDCAHAFYTADKEMGKIGDYIIYSLPKAFPMQIGAILAANKPLKTLPQKDSSLEEYVLSNLASYPNTIHDSKEKRIHNYYRLCKGLKPLEIEPYFELKAGIYPGVFLFRWLDTIDYPQLKTFMQANGIECSVFYGEKAFYIPCHQELSTKEIEYMITLLRYYKENFYA